MIQFLKSIHTKDKTTRAVPWLFDFFIGIGAHEEFKRKNFNKPSVDEGE